MGLSALTDAGEGRYRRCDICGIRYTQEEMTKNWKGQQVCKYDYEPRHPAELYQAKPPRRILPMGRGEGEYIVDAAKSELSFTAINNLNSGDSVLSIQISTATYVPRAGDTLEYDYFIEQCPVGGVLGGMRIGFVDLSFMTTDLDSDDGNLNWSPRALKTGQDPTTRSGKWYHRKISLASKVGSVPASYELVCDGNAVGTYICHYKNIVVRDSAGQLAQIIWVSGDPALSTVILQTNYAGPNVLAATTSFI